jgi:hypothetical protein
MDVTAQALGKPCKRCGSMDRYPNRSCRPCAVRRAKKWNLDHPERARETERKRQHKHGQEYHLKYKYGLTVEQYNQMLASQGGVCKICKRPQTDPKKRFLCVDHNHETKKIRGLLCHHCNSALGFLRDNKNLLPAVLAYLEDD